MNRTLGLKLGPTNCINTSFDVSPGSFVQNNTGVPQYQGMLGMKVDLDAKTVAAHWDTAKSPAPKTALELRYVSLALTDLDVAPVCGTLLYWKDKSKLLVNANDDESLEFAGICPGVVPNIAGEIPANPFLWMIVGGEPEVLFINPTTKNGSETGFTAVAVSGNSGKADVLAGATAQTYTTESADQIVGRVTAAIDATSHRGTVALMRREYF